MKRKKSLTGREYKAVKVKITIEEI